MHTFCFIMAFNTHMHERNIYKVRPDFANLALEYPEFRKHVYPDAKGKYHVDFTNTETLRVLTQILLKKDFKLAVEIPNGFLIPTVPQRLNYILWVEDLLNVTSQESNDVRGIDIGTGPCAIFSLLGARKNNWRFVATESSDEAIRWATKNIQANDLQDNIQIVRVDKNSILKEALNSTDKTFNFCLCNPPFFDNIEEIRRKNARLKETIADVAKKEEIFAEGGEIAFVKNMIEDSLFFKKQISLYTSMFGKKKSFIHILNELKNIPDIKVTTSEFCQGNTVRWGIAWTFEQSFEFPKEKKVKAKTKPKSKPPLVYRVPETVHNPDVIVPPVLERLIGIMNELKISVTIHRASKNFAEVQIKAIKNTWSHQRRKRREMLRKCIQPAENETAESKPMENVPKDSEINDDDANACESGQGHDKSFMTKAKTLDTEIKTEVEDLNSNLEKNNNPACSIDSNTATQLVPLKNICIASKTQGSTLLHDDQNETSLTKKPKCSEEECVQKSNLNTETDEIQKGMLKTPMNKRKHDNCSLEHDEERVTKKVCLSEKSKSTDSTTLIPNEAHLMQKSNDNKDEHVQKSVVNKEVDEIQEFMSHNPVKKRKHEICSSHETEEVSKKLCIDKKGEKDDFKMSVKNEIELENASILVAEECTALLDSIIRVRKAKDHILLEMTCISDNYREPMHQVFQLIKNKLK
ncbi:RNA N6-adenosine-methyltransferase mettl16-like [Uloborus diversus]|uniref:RNA N6-adenosine-methyltransferase mettl16-like n=1 Tax=Uloborus diversus TaxID=327109 RepID=UPI00240A39CA|nr:RNA N6-adenosine-methyltransferase mettl16-like [Uloborus diversus]